LVRKIKNKMLRSRPRCLFTAAHRSAQIPACIPLLVSRASTHIRYRFSCYSLDSSDERNKRARGCSVTSTRPQGHSAQTLPLRPQQYPETPTQNAIPTILALASSVAVSSHSSFPTSPGDAALAEGELEGLVDGSDDEELEEGPLLKLGLLEGDEEGWAETMGDA
jgi:hypothetical protein